MNKTHETEVGALILLAQAAFVSGCADSAVPAKHFALPPYSVMPMNDKHPQGLCGVANKQGFNCLTFTNAPGAVFAPREIAEEITRRWNHNKEST